MVDININSNRKFVCVDYPAKVNNPSKMLETMGGIKELSEVHYSTDKRLQLRFRPRDIYCKPAYGDREESCSLLMKIKRKKNTDANCVVQPEIIGIIPTTYKFNSMMEFQYLPMSKTSSGDYKTLLPDVLPKDVETELSWLAEEDGTSFVTPAIFSRIEIPQNYHFRRPPEPKNSESEVDKLPSNIIGKCRKFRGSKYKLVNFPEEVPTEPDPDRLQISTNELNREYYDSLVKFFEERPIWSRNALMVLTKWDRPTLKKIISAVAYYYLSGPWRGLWVRFGYDAQRHVDSMQYQLIDYRIKHAYGIHLIDISHKRQCLENSLPNSKTKKKSNFSVTLPISEPIEASDTSGFETTIGSKLKIIDEESVYKFKPGVLPPFRQMFYQLCDIELDEVRRLLNQKKYLTDDCHTNSGWLTSEFFTKCRNIIDRSIHETYRSLVSEGTTATGNSQTSEEKARDMTERDYDKYDNEMATELLEYMEDDE